MKNLIKNTHKTTAIRHGLFAFLFIAMGCQAAHHEQPGRINLNPVDTHRYQTVSNPHYYHPISGSGLNQKDHNLVQKTISKSYANPVLHIDILDFITLVDTIARNRLQLTSFDIQELKMALNNHIMPAMGILQTQDPALYTALQLGPKFTQLQQFAASPMTFQPAAAAPALTTSAASQLVNFNNLLPLLGETASVMKTARNNPNVLFKTDRLNNLLQEMQTNGLDVNNVRTITHDQDNQANLAKLTGSLDLPAPYYEEYNLARLFLNRLAAAISKLQGLVLTINARSNWPDPLAHQQALMQEITEVTESIDYLLNNTAFSPILQKLPVYAMEH